MRIVFMGTPKFAADILKKIVEEKFDVVGVFTNPDKPVGRKQIVDQSEVKKTACNLSIKLFQPEEFGKNEIDMLKSLNLDVIVVVAYGKILPKSVLNVPKYGCYNVHASLLPKYRGASPIQTSIINCDEETGISIIKMTPGIDDGDILKTCKTKIGINETFLELSDRLCKLGGEAICEILWKISQGHKIIATQQEEEKASFVFKIKPEMGKINFHKKAFNVHKLICGFSSWPVAYCFFNGKKMKVFKSLFKNNLIGKPGEVLDDKKFIVACKEGAVEFLEVQLQDRKKMLAKDFLNGCVLKKGCFLI